MPNSDFNLFAKDLEKDLRPIQNRLASDGTRIHALFALMAGRGAGLPDDTRFPIAAAVALSRQPSLIHDDAQDRDTHGSGQAPAWAVAGICAAIGPGDRLISALLGALSGLPCLTGLFSDGISPAAPGRVRSDQHEQIVRQKSGPLPGLPIDLAPAGGTDARIGRIPVGAAAIGIARQLADDLTDKAEDPKARLNGHGLLEGLLAAGAAAETMSRDRPGWPLSSARQSARNLPVFCMAAVEALIEALRQPYPARGAAA